MGFDRLIRPLGRLRRLPPLVVDAGIAAIFIVMVAAEAVRQPMPGGRTALLAVLTLVLAVKLGAATQVALRRAGDRGCGARRRSFLHVATAFLPSPPWSARTPSACTPLGPALDGDC